MQNGNRKIKVERLNEEEFRVVICYPSCRRGEFKRRLTELRTLKIEEVEFGGSHARIYNTPVLGKGCVGIVVKAYRGDEKVALKIRRTDSDRSTMQREAEMLIKANKNNVGPQMLAVTENFLMMEYVEGTLLPDWIKTLSGKNAEERLRRFLRLVLEQAWRLDKAGLDHGELSHAPKHIIVRLDGTPCLVDFETASISRRPSNITALCQYLFIGSPVAELIRIELDEPSTYDLVNALRTYKKRRRRKNFDEVLAKCTLR